MNIDRALGQVARSTSGDAGTPAARHGDAKPVFTLPDHDAAPAHAAASKAHATMPTTRGTSPQAHDAMRSRDAQPAQRAPAEREPAAQARDAGARPHDGPNAASRREGRDAHASSRRDQDEATESATETADNARAAEPARRDAPRSDDDATALPDRMLALLSGGPLTAAPAPAAGTATNVQPMSLQAGTLATEAALASTATPLVGSFPADTSGAMRGVLPNAANAGDAAMMNAAASMPSPSNAQSAPSPGDALAAFAALTERSRDGGASRLDTAPDGSGFAPLLARGAEPQAALRAAPAITPPSMPLLLDADFDDGLGARITWMADQRIDHAQIRVSPEALGPIDVRLQVDGHRVTAQFHAANADVRQALESGMDRLRDLLGRQGMELGQAQVGSGARQGPDGRAGAPARGDRGAGGEPTSGEQTIRVSIPRSRGLLDEYA